MYIGADDLTAAMGKMELVQLTNDNAQGRNPTLRSLSRQCVMPVIWWTDT